MGEQRPGDLAALMSRVTLATVTAAPDQLAEIVRQVLRDFLLPALPEAAVYLVEVDGRWAGATGWLAFCARRKTTRPCSCGHRPRGGRARLQLGAWPVQRHQPRAGAYLAPLFLALAPWAWAAPAKRPGGVVIYTFGCLAAGRRSEAAELLQLFFPEGRAESGPKPAGLPRRHPCRADLVEPRRWTASSPRSPTRRDMPGTTGRTA